jgi:uncharacterized protein (DUF58 family)
MLTTRGWSLLFVVLFLLFCGLLASHPLLIVVGVALLLWFGGEWFLFNLRLHTALADLRVERVVEDDRGPVTTLWFGHTFTVRVRLVAKGRLPFVRLSDFLPFAVELDARLRDFGGATERCGPVAAGQPMVVIYRILCPTVGVARFEGVRVQVADHQGFFYHSTFLSDPVVYRVLPMLLDSETQTAASKRHNQLMPPGIHRLKRPGSGSELLDLRDYMTGDPPKTIAWKVSARRDKLITKEFESEVPVRCTLFVDVSNSVRVPSRQGKPLHRLIEIAASVVQANTSIRDLTGLCAFDERNATFVRPERSGKHLTNILRTLADAAAQTPILDRVDPDSLLPLAYSFACEAYPRLMDRGLNSMPFLLQVLDAFPGYGRRRRSLWQRFHHWKRPLFNFCFKTLPMALFIANALLTICVLADLVRLDPLQVHLPLVVLSFAIPFSAMAAGSTIILGRLIFSAGTLRTAYWRKRLAALLSVRYGLAPGGLAALLEDDDQFALLLQRFLAEHQVPYRLPLYDASGKYLFASPEKVAVLASALLRSVAKGRDNELFVLLVDLLELDEHLDPLLRAVRVALGRHHQVIMICPWPPRMRPPGDEPQKPLPTATPNAPEQFRVFLHQSQRKRFHEAFHRVRHTFARLGVHLVCAASEEPVGLILNRLDRLRSLRRTR